MKSITMIRFYGNSKAFIKHLKLIIVIPELIDVKVTVYWIPQQNYRDCVQLINSHLLPILSKILSPLKKLVSTLVN